MDSPIQGSGTSVDLHATDTGSEFPGPWFAASLGGSMRAG